MPAQGKLTKAEWVVMETRKHVTATEVQRDLTATQGWAYSTVKTMLDRLAAKGALRAERVGGGYTYSARLSRQRGVSIEIDDLVERILHGSLLPFFSHLIERRRLSRAEVEEIRDMLARYEND